MEKSTEYILLSCVLGPIFLDNMVCSGEETSLLECGHNPLGDTDCGHDEDVGLMCESVHPEGRSLN